MGHLRIAATSVAGVAVLLALPTFLVGSIAPASVAAAGESFAVGDVVWADVDGDGLRDRSEPGVPEVTVELLDARGEVLRTTTTDADGRWTIDGLPAGVYSLRFAHLPAGASLTAAGRGTGSNDSDADPRTGVTPPFVLAPGAPRVRASTGADGVRAALMAPTMDAGLVMPTFAIQDQAWRDDDGDGQRDPAEPPALGVRVDVVSDDGTVVATAHTGPNGVATLDGVPPGRYRLRYPGLPDGVGFTRPSPSTGGSAVRLGSDATAPFTLAPVEYGVRRAQATDGVTADYVADGFGVGLTATAYALGNLVWRDTDGNGVHGADEPGVAGVAVTLVAGGRDMASTVTDRLGHYAFDRLPAGRYAVRFTAPPGLAFSGPGLGGPAVDSDPGAQGLTATLTLGPDAGLRPRSRSDVAAGITAPLVDATVDAGLVGRTFALGDEVWLDDGDGVIEPGERGAPDVDVVLLDAAGAPVATTTTDRTGRYVFDGLAAGMYSVALRSLPAGLEAAPPNRGAIDTDSDLDPRTGVTLPNNLTPYGTGIRAVRVGDGVSAAFVDLHVDLGLVAVTP